MTSDKFTVLYSFRIKEGKEEAFIDSWSEMTQLIYEYEGSYGARLHKAYDNFYIAYAQWPNRKSWESSGTKLPPSAKAVRQQLFESCIEIKTDYELKIVKDLLYEDFY
ncbi:antibiotic biosynthesis monooxygenase family protein [Aurantibacillus circumpalustris]|uniref:antibiotic biosynthesis monooxygenase family protein n=1 Tax=Aurantibacillus circumpalustris TaxID=3036359 RepID=UPI00295BBE76|nr:antibiotic biosynthesis monooxygenase [Aurantibacillus circumpalustris]